MDSVVGGALLGSAVAEATPDAAVGGADSGPQRMPIWIKAIGVHTPPGVPIDKRMQEEVGLSDFDARLFRRMYGFSHVARDPHATETELLVRAIADLPNRDSWLPRVKHVIRARTTRSPSPYPQSALADTMMAVGLTHVPAFSMADQACATGIQALDVAGDLLADEDPEALVLLLAGEKCYGDVGRVMRNMAVLGEATVAVLIGSQGPGSKVLSDCIRTHPLLDTGLLLGPEAMEEFTQTVGPAMFEAASTAVGRMPDSRLPVDGYVAASVNKVATLGMAERMGIDPANVVLSNVAQLGHCFSADVFINLKSGLDEGTIRKGQRVLLSSVGVGSTYGAAVIEV